MLDDAQRSEEREESGRARTALRQWRDSLVALNGVNPLLNYRATAKTLEFARQTMAEVSATISSPTETYIMGTRPETGPRRELSEEAETLDELADAMLDEVQETDLSAHPDHLFVDKTQHDVDRALRSIAADERRAFVDKGIRTLYVAFGELVWEEANGNRRRSPLLLVPAELVSPGPRERRFLTFAEGEVVVNPALAIRLSDEIGLDLPTGEDALETIEQEGIEAAVDLFRSLRYPDGWEVRELAALRTFMFAKEAMYRDLLDNEERIVESPIVKSLSGEISPTESPFLFEPYDDAEIDVVAPPETTPLVLDADSSQRAAVQAAVEGKSFTLDGPPGTGKSQTIANIIGALIAAGKRVLFVSEKAVALDVVHSRLKQSGLGAFVFHLHSAKSSRKEVAAQLGAALASDPVPPHGLSLAQLAQLRADREALTAYVVAANEKRLPLGVTFHEVLGWYEQTRTAHVGPELDGDVSTLTADGLQEIQRSIEAVTRLWDLHQQGESAPWYGLTHHGDVRYLLTKLDTSIAAMEQIRADVESIAHAFGLHPERDLSRLLLLLERWHAEPAHHDAAWLSADELSTLASSADRCLSAAIALESVERRAEEAWLGGWERRGDEAPVSLPEMEESLTRISGLSAEGTGEAVERALEKAQRAIDLLRGLQGRSSDLAKLIGARAPRTVIEVEQVIAAARALLSDAEPQLEWCYEPGALRRARAAVTQARGARAELDAAAVSAGETFTAQALSVDLDAIERLASTARGISRRLSADHRELRRRLAEISLASWKTALENLPSARRWSAAHTEYATRMRAAAAVLGEHLDEVSGAAAARLDRRLSHAEDTARARLVDREATALLLADSATQADARELLAEAASALASWQETVASRETVAQSLDESFVQTGESIDASTETLRCWRSLVSAQRDGLGAGATLAQHQTAARVRADYDRALGEVMRAQREMGDALDGRYDVVPSVQSARRLHDGTQWADSVLAAAGGGKKPRAFTAAQLAALRSSSFTTDASSVVQEHGKIVDEVIGWFDEDRRSVLRGTFARLDRARDLTSRMLSRAEETTDWFALRSAAARLDSAGLGRVREHARETSMGRDDARKLLLHTVFGAWLDAQLRADDRLTGVDGLDRDGMVSRFRELDRDLAGEAVATIIREGVERRPKSSQGQAAIIRREAEKKRKHMPVRQLISDAREVILAMHPCFMMSPLAVSQFLPSDELFDVVIFDEASQVLPGDAINSVYRGASLIAAGDQKQLPPTSFFDVSSDAEDDDAEEDYAKDFESILDLMKGSGSFSTQSLRWHYRSRHEHLISYSNTSFYENRLITFPGAIRESDDLGVTFIKVDGTYRRSGPRDNPIEAREVAKRVVHHYETRSEKSLGVVAFSTTQRDAIEAAVELARRERPHLDGYFGHDRADAFFVKSLEEVQGDERDVIIFSIGYGPDEHGKVHRNFGPVNRNGGERRLNVAVTRAKELVEVVASMTAGDIGEVPSTGARHLKRYLDFAERGDGALALELGPEGLDTESPFEDAVVDYVRSLGFEVQPQVGVAGYRIDIGVKHPEQPGVFLVGVECDGAMYHSSRAARDRDRLRHEILEGLGWKLHHIWGTSWYRQPNREKERLRLLLEDLARQPVVGRLSAPNSHASGVPPVETTTRTLSHDPDWVVDYEVAEEGVGIRGLDLSDPLSASDLAYPVDVITRVEAPMHIDVLLERVREHSDYGRMGRRIRQTVVAAVEKLDVDFDGEFIRRPEARQDVRRGGPDIRRTIAQIPPEELRRAVTNLVADAISITRVDLVAGIVDIFGWRRTGSDIRSRIEAEIAWLLHQGVLREGPSGLQLSEELGAPRPPLH
ncbi:DUF3320 domain-containing protein [Microbacterium sp. gxy059]|uniref:DUF3320 domain-containing protein n=1 Tax=Microbacterium sp. gxy059 TaxID=2957199 RepID=UPI003D97BE55